MLLYTDGNVYVVETHPIAIQMVDENGNPIEGHFSFEWRVELSSLEDLDFDGNQDLSNLSKGVRIGETVLSGKTVELIEFKNNDGSRAVLWLDKEFEVPMRAEKQRLVNGKWTTVRRLDFDFSKKLDPSLFRWKQEPKAGK